MLYSLLSCVLTFSQMFPAMVKPIKLHNLLKAAKTSGICQIHLLLCFNVRERPLLAKHAHCVFKQCPFSLVNYYLIASLPL